MTTLHAAPDAARSVWTGLRQQALQPCARAFALAAMLLCGVANGQYPEKPVHIVVPFAAGAGADIASRFMADKLSAMWDKGVVVENMVGANGIIGAQHVARAQIGRAHV